jgi:cell division protein FtsW (lipid II flippase)
MLTIMIVAGLAFLYILYIEMKKDRNPGVLLIITSFLILAVVVTQLLCSEVHLERRPLTIFLSVFAGIFFVATLVAFFMERKEKSSSQQQEVA